MIRTIRTIFRACIVFIVCVAFQVFAEWLLGVFYEWESVVLFFGGHIVRAIISIKFGKFLIELLQEGISNDPNAPDFVQYLVYLPFGFLMYIVPIGSSVLDLIANDF